jgi:hypothetical protein
MHDGTRLPAAQQVAHYRLLRERESHPISFWQNAPSELKSLSRLALKFLGLLGTSASVEQTFSVARSITADDRMAMAQETVSARTMVQANWEIAAPFLVDILHAGPNAWKTAHWERKARKQTGGTSWQLSMIHDGPTPN